MTTPRPALEHQLGRAMAVIADMKAEIERLQAAGAQAHDSRALAAEVASLKEQLSAEHFQLTKLGFEKQAADTKHARRIEELEEEVRQYKGEAHTQGESKDSLQRQLQRGHGELLATRQLLGVGPGERLEDKVRERLQASEDKVAQLQAAYILHKGQMEAQAQEHAAALQRALGQATVAFQEAEVVKKLKARLEKSTTARETALEAEVRRLEKALNESKKEATELRETSEDLQNLWRAQQEDAQQQQQSAAETEGLTELVGHITSLLGQLEQQAHATTQGSGSHSDSRSPSVSMLSEGDEHSEASSRLIQPEELVAHDDLSDRGMDHSQYMVQQLASGAIEMAEVLAQRSKEFELALEQARREKLFHEARAMYAAQHCMRLREQTQAVSAKAAGFVAHAEALLRARSNSNDSSSSKRRSRFSTTSTTSSSSRETDMPVASDAEILAALKATKDELEHALFSQYEAHTLLENELKAEAGSNSDSVRTAMETLPPASASSASSAAVLPPLPSPLKAAATYHPVPNAAALQEEEAKLKRQRRKLAEERKRSEALSAHLSMQKRSIDEQMAMLSEQVAHSRQYLERRKAELEARGAVVDMPVVTTPAPRAASRLSSAPPLDPMDVSSLSLLKKKKAGQQQQAKSHADAESADSESRPRSRSFVPYTPDTKGGLGEPPSTTTTRHRRTSSASSALSSGSRFSLNGKRLSSSSSKGAGKVVEEDPLVDTSDLMRVHAECKRLESRLMQEKTMAQHHP